MEWYWWGLFIVFIAVLIPFKVKFIKWWDRRSKNKKSEVYDNDD